MTGKTDIKFPEKLFIIKYYRATSGVNIAQSGNKNYAASAMGYENPTETINGEQITYTPIGIARVSAGSSLLGLCGFSTDPSSSAAIQVRNGSNSDASSVRPIIEIVYAPEYLVGNGKLFKKDNLSKEYTLNNSSTAWITGTDLNYNKPAGYEFFSLTKATSGTSHVQMTSFGLYPEGSSYPYGSNSSPYFELRNVSGSSRSTTCSMEVVFIKKEFAEIIAAST